MGSPTIRGTATGAAIHPWTPPFMARKD